MRRRALIPALALLASAALSMALAGAARAQAGWPDRPIRVLLPFPPGGPSDMVALAVSGSHRVPTLPEVPTMAEAGAKGYAAEFSLVMFAPRATPEPVVTRFRQAFVDALRSPDVVDKLRASDQAVVGSMPGEAARSLAADSIKWGEVARRIKLGLD